MEPKIPGALQFLYYAYPCVEALVERGKIKTFEVEELTRCVDQRIAPDHRLMVRCFPSAVRRFVEKTGIDPLALTDWPIELVREYWRRHKGRFSECSVRCGRVVIFKEIVAQVNVEGKMVPAFNRYKFAIAAGDLVSIHKFVIAKVEKNGSS